MYRLINQSIDREALGTRSVLQVFGNLSLALVWTLTAAALICLQTHHIWSLPAAEVWKPGLVPRWQRCQQANELMCPHIASSFKALTRLQLVPVCSDHTVQRTVTNLWPCFSKLSLTYTSSSYTVRLSFWCLSLFPNFLAFEAFYERGVRGGIEPRATAASVGSCSTNWENILWCPIPGLLWTLFYPPLTLRGTAWLGEKSLSLTFSPTSYSLVMFHPGSEGSHYSHHI